MYWLGPLGSRRPELEVLWEKRSWKKEAESRKRPSKPSECGQVCHLWKEKGKEGEMVRKRLRQWCSSEEVSARPKGLKIAHSWVLCWPEMMVSICLAAVGWDYLRRVSHVLQALLPEPVTWEPARPLMVSVAAVVLLHGGHKDLGLGGLGPWCLPHSHWIEREYRASVGRLSMPILGIARIPFARIPLPKTQWSHLVARETGKWTVAVRPGRTESQLCLLTV